jgi:hypothetical protein
MKLLSLSFPRRRKTFGFVTMTNSHNHFITCSSELKPSGRLKIKTDLPLLLRLWSYGTIILSLGLQTRNSFMKRSALKDSKLANATCRS